MWIYISLAIFESYYIVHVNVKFETLLNKKFYRALSHLHFGPRLFYFCKASKVGINIVLGVIVSIAMFLKKLFDMWSVILSSWRASLRFKQIFPVALVRCKLCARLLYTFCIMHRYRIKVKVVVLLKWYINSWRTRISLCNSTNRWD